MTDVAGGRFKELDEGGLYCGTRTLSGWSVAALVTSSTELAFSRRLDVVVVAAAKLVVLSMLERMYVVFADRGEGDVGLCMFSTLLQCFTAFGFELNALEAESCSTTGDVDAREDTVSCVVDAMMS